MESRNLEDDRPDPISIAHWRKLLGDEADELSDHEVDRVRQHADALAHMLVEIFVLLPREPREVERYDTEGNRVGAPIP